MQNLPFIKIIQKKFTAKRKSKISTPAKLVDKKLHFSKNNSSSYNLVFELYTGSKLTFKVNEYQYSEFNNGDKGILIYKEDKFINFKTKY